VVTIGGNRAVFLAGPPGAPPSLVVASIEDGRILKRLPGTEGAAPQDLAASHDGRTVYYPDRGNLWAIDVDANTPPRKLVAGHGVAAFPDGNELLVQRNGMNGVDLFRVPVAGGYELRIPLQGDLRLAPAPLSGRAVGPDGRIVVTVASRSSWRWGPAFLDPATGAVERIPVVFEGDVQSAGWADAANLVGLGVGLRTELWRFRELD
jgi:DNA-binding beta-propeller fold protein YncE